MFHRLVYNRCYLFLHAKFTFRLFLINSLLILYITKELMLQYRVFQKYWSFLINQDTGCSINMANLVSKQKCESICGLNRQIFPQDLPWEWVSNRNSSVQNLMPQENPADNTRKNKMGIQAPNLKYMLVSIPCNCSNNRP